ncbi:SDR family oxidoreductase [Solirubrobacter phytolaccae]|uniref:SDR family oxidoreductase n=1 Tax=Solirubrobacter phytolaccae TaxID=1404360 RepID=A0A9X3NCV8_9ACTN|nr:SDR family oxidoreductase [Solirubrobacter phytolaccae]MDA0183766.1 SDR family oxidoreductase [Solirubrobacter phytolaccae]
MDITGRVALVTGASVGSGRAIAQRLLDAGADVVAADIGPDPGLGRFVALDVTHDAALIVAMDELRPTILVNNAGGGGHLPPHFPEATVDAWSAMLALNLRAPMLATQHMRSGVVINIASSAGVEDGPHPSPEYSAAKAGLIRFTTALRMPGVRVNCVVPGWLLTDRAREELAAMTPEERAAAPEPIPLERLTEAVVALIVDDARSGAVFELL